MTDAEESTTVRMTKAQRDAGNEKKPDGMTAGEWYAADAGALDAIADAVAEKVADKLADAGPDVQTTDTGGSFIDQMRTRDADGDDEAGDCPECGGPLADSLGGAETCIACGHVTDDGND
jgi:sirohydrochlorin ferrochelatase